MEEQKENAANHSKKHMTPKGKRIYPTDSDENIDANSIDREFISVDPNSSEETETEASEIKPGNPGQSTKTCEVEIETCNGCHLFFSFHEIHLPSCSHDRSCRYVFK